MVKSSSKSNILRALIEQLAGSGQRKISISEANMETRIVYDSEIAGFAAMGTRQIANHQARLRVTDNEKTNSPQRRNLHENILVTKWQMAGRF